MHLNVLIIISLPENIVNENFTILIASPDTDGLFIQLFEGQQLPWISDDDLTGEPVSLILCTIVLLEFLSIYRTTGKHPDL